MANNAKHVLIVISQIRRQQQHKDAGPDQPFFFFFFRPSHHRLKRPSYQPDFTAPASHAPATLTGQLARLHGSNLKRRRVHNQAVHFWDTLTANKDNCAGFTPYETVTEQQHVKRKYKMTLLNTEEYASAGLKQQLQVSVKLVNYCALKINCKQAC